MILFQKKLKPLLLIAAFVAASTVPAAGPASIGGLAGATGAGGEDQLQRLRAAHVKDLALSEQARKLYDDFESLALEYAKVPERDMKDIWSSASDIFKLTPNNADDAKEVVQWYTEIFTLTRELAEREAALDGLGEPEKGNDEKNDAIKEQKKRVKKARKRIQKLKKKIQNGIKSIIQYDDEGEQQQGLENWLMVSTGLLRDEREAAEEKKMIENLPPVIMKANDAAEDTESQ